MPTILLEKRILKDYSRNQDVIMANRIVKYNPAFLSDAELRESFVVRHGELREIVGLLTGRGEEPGRHILIVGPRGSGKTTLVRRIAIEMESDEAIFGRWHPLILSEENYEIATEGEFWLEALVRIAGQTGGDRWRQACDELQKVTDDRRLAARALAELLDFADETGKRILLIVENVNVLFDDAMGADAVRRVLQTLAAEPRLSLLATATGPFSALSEGPQALRGMFSVRELQPLGDEACRLVWEAVAGKRPPGDEIRPVRILTGGNARLVVVLAGIAAGRPFREFLDNLVGLIDDHTEYFKGQLDRLPPIERKVFLALAELWDPATARDVAGTARLDVNKTSALLNRLVGRGAVLVEERKKTKRYTVAERMYNIYYLLRRSGGPTDRVRALVAFMVAMYGAGRAAEEAGRPLSEPCGDYGLACAEIAEAMPGCRVPEAVAPFLTRLSAEAACSGEVPEDTGRRSANKPPQGVPSEKDKAEREAALAAAGQCLGFLQEGRYAEAGEGCSEAMKLLASSSGVGAIAFAALAMLGEGIALKGMNRAEDAIRVYDQIGALYGDYTEPEIAVLVARAMIDKGLILAESGRPGEAMAVYDEAIVRYRDRPERPLATQAARAMVCEGRTFGCLGRDADAEMAFRQAVDLYPAGADGGILLVRLLLKNPGRAEEARGMAEAAAGRNPDNPGLLDALAGAFYESGEPSLLPQEEAWARRAVALDPGDPGKRITLACILAALGKGDEALALADGCLKDEDFVAVTIGRAIELFVELAAAGYTREALGLLADAPAARHLEPLVAGLRLFAGEDVKTAVEIREVAADVVKRIEARRASRRLTPRPVR